MSTKIKHSKLQVNLPFNLLKLTNPLIAFFLLYVYFRNAWSSLGEMPKEQAMRSFIEGVLKQMPELKPYLEAHKTAAAAAAATNSSSNDAAKKTQSGGGDSAEPSTNG